MILDEVHSAPPFGLGRMERPYAHPTRTWIILFELQACAQHDAHLAARRDADPLIAPMMRGIVVAHFWLLPS
jgi:hypothetical protein